MGRLEGLTAIVTGAALGIGRAACLRLAGEGARVAVTDILDSEGRALAEEIERSGGRARYWQIDVRNEDQIRSAFRDVREHFGRVDVLVNNAGISGANKPTDQVTQEEWEEVMAVNVRGVFLCTKHVIAYLREAGGGSIINLSSIYGIVSAADVPPYHASKGAVRLMTKTDALIYARDRIRVNSIHPGFIWTPMVANFGRMQPGGLEEFRRAIADQHPLGSIGEPDDIAWGIVYLAASESKFVTGSELVIDGGYTCR